MTEKMLRHIVSFIATLVTGIAFYAGYVAGQYGWWWLAFSIAIVYWMIFKLVDAGHHGGGHH